MNQICSLSTERRRRFIRAGWLIDGSGERVHEDVLLEIGDGRISKITAFESDADLKSQVDDFSECTLLPGLIDSHVHLFMSGTTHRHLRDKQLTADFRETKKIISHHLARHLFSGVVAVRDGGDRQGFVLRYKRSHHDPERLPVYVGVAGRAFRARGRYGRLIGAAIGKNETLAEAISAADQDVDHVKIVNSGLNSLIRFGKRTKPQFELEEMIRAVEAAHRKDLKVMVHANGEVPVDISLRAGCDSIEHGFFMGKENLTRMAGEGIIWVPTACTMQGYLESMKPSDRGYDGCQKNLDHQLEQLSVARDLGVPVAMGTDSGSIGVDHGESLRMEWALFTKAGYAYEEVARNASMNGAKLLGLENLGSLSEGKSATFVAVEGEPSMLPESLGRIRKVFVNGVFVNRPDQMVSNADDIDVI